MEGQKKAPTTFGEAKGAIKINDHNKSTESLPRIQRLVYNLLSKGGKYSNADISVALHLSDPRSAIKELRDKGICISDEWVTSRCQCRYKRYWIREGV